MAFILNTFQNLPHFRLLGIVLYSLQNSIKSDSHCSESCEKKLLDLTVLLYRKEHCCSEMDGCAQDQWLTIEPVFSPQGRVVCLCAKEKVSFLVSLGPVCSYISLSEEGSWQITVFPGFSSISIK